MRKVFVVVSGVPGSGKTTLARRLAPAMQLSMVDKDDILERLFSTRGVGDAAWRRTLSRESDAILVREATQLEGGVLASFWWLPGMPGDSGTPTAWLQALALPVVNVHCIVEPELAARRFVQRQRHPGHLDHATSYEAVLANVRELALLGAPDMARQVVVDTATDTPIQKVVARIDAALADG